MTNLEIESKVDKLLSDFFNSKKEGISTPVPVIDILEYLGYDIDFRNDGIYEDKDILGGVIPEQKKVELNEVLSQNEGWLNFTVAHEIGHIILHLPLDNKNKLFREGDNCKNNEDLKEKSRKLIEIEADKFAAYLLMPGNIIKNSFFRTYKKPVNVSKFSIKDLLFRKSPKQKAFYVASKISNNGNFSNVSKRAIINRLIGLNLIRGIPFQTNTIKKEKK